MGRRVFVFDGPVDLRQLRDFKLDKSNLFFNGHFDLQHLAGVDLRGVTLNFCKCGKAKAGAASGGADLPPPIVLQPFNPTTLPARALTSTNSRKRQRSSSPEGRASRITADRWPRGMSPGAHPSGYSSSHWSPSHDSRPTRYRTKTRAPSPSRYNVSSSSPVPVSDSGIHPERSLMLQCSADADLSPPRQPSPVGPQRTSSNTIGMPFNRLTGGSHPTPRHAETPKPCDPVLVPTNPVSQADVAINRAEIIRTKLADLKARTPSSTPGYHREREAGRLSPVDQFLDQLASTMCESSCCADASVTSDKIKQESQSPKPMLAAQVEAEEGAKGEMDMQDAGGI